jgi:hypothetical protein
VQSEAPPRNETSVPWSDVAVDLIGPWKVQVGERLLEISALTSIDIASTLGEIIRIEEKTSEHVFQKFENLWLARYPRPIRVIHDQGGEFTGHPFQVG